jgi:hypothetical protein
MLLNQSFDFLVKTYKDKQQEVPDLTLEGAYKRKRLECCNDECRVN